MSDARKASVYFPASMIRDLRREVLRLDRSFSWVVQRCVKIGLSELKKLPSMQDVDEAELDAMDEKDEKG